MRIYTLLFFMSCMAVFKLQAQEERKDFKQFYNQHQLKGTFVMCDQKKGPLPIL